MPLLLDASLELQQHQLRQIAVEEPPKKEAQANAVTPKPKANGQGRGSPPASPPKNESKPPEAKKGGKTGGKGKRSESEPRPEKQKQQCIPFFRGMCQKSDQCKYELCRPLSTKEPSN